LEEIFITVEANEAFVFSGYRQLSIRIPPLSHHQISYNYFPLVSGRVFLPRVKFIRKSESGDQVLSVSGHNNPTWLTPLEGKETPGITPMNSVIVTTNNSIPPMNEDLPLSIFVSPKSGW